MSDLKSLFLDIKNNWFDRTIMAILFTILFFVAGYYGPKIYYQYLSQKNYISFNNPITFNKKIFTACETMTSIVKWHSSVVSNVYAQTRLLRVDTKVFTEIKTYQSKTFTGVTPEDGVLYRIMFTLPCNIQPGFYVFDGVYSYHVKGVRRTYSFVTTQIEIRQQPSVKSTPQPSLNLSAPVSGTSATLAPTSAQATYTVQDNVPAQNTIILAPSQAQTQPTPSPTPDRLQICIPLAGCVIK